LPGENDPGNADGFAFNFEAFLFDINNLGFQLACLAVMAAFWTTRLLAAFVTLEATCLNLLTWHREHCQRKKRQCTGGHERFHNLVPFLKWAIEF
jgi:hypothetical protein